MNGFSLSFLNQYHIESKNNTDLMTYRNCDPEFPGTNGGVIINAGIKQKFYTKIKNPYSTIPVRNIKSDYKLHINFAGMTTYVKEND